MATINNDFPTLMDLAKATGPDGSMIPIVDAISKRNSVMEDAVWKEGNLTTGHRIGSLTALPSVAWRRINEGVSPSKSRNDQVDETCGLLTGMSQVDKALVQLNGGMAFRGAQDKRFLAAMANEFETGFFYHSTKATPEKFMGVLPRLDSTTGPAGGQIIKADPSPSGSDQASAVLVGWGQDSVYCIYPKGTRQGLTPTDMGLQSLDDGTGKKFPGYQTFWEWAVGVCVEDWRYLVRVANIDTSALLTTGRLIIDAMVNAYYQLQDTTNVKPVWYVNRKVATYLHHQSNDAAKNTVTFDNVGGKEVMRFLGIPVRRTDALLNTEAIVS